MKDCGCKLWDKNIDEYNNMFNFVEKYHGPSYEGDEYCFCPWCGTDLIEGEADWEEDDEEEIDLIPMHGDEEEDDEDEEEEEFEDWEYELDFVLEPEAITYPTLKEGWCSDN